MQMIKVDDNGLNQLRDALRQAALPCDDVSEPGRQFYRFEVAGEWVAFGGLEGSAPDMLLRSMVVCDERRGKGLGKQVLLALEQCAASQGVLRLHLLTQGAAGFFAANGYERFDRHEAPGAIKQTAQFEHLCPASASYLRKTFSASQNDNFGLRKVLALAIFGQQSGEANKTAGRCSRHCSLNALSTRSSSGFNR
ncbi:arsenic resistance N-acetyltransferase ArsN2 [Pseudomonas sp. LT1P18]|uniref:arsenic resistance N-acetyltransferase ArsN2 n=1 Tax=Pseudomonas arabinosi TaxID=3398357 RepID=UPI0039EE6226